jgi:hypothetical protein
MGALPAEQPLAFPNVETLLVSFLTGRRELSGVAVGVRLPPDFNPASRAVVVFRTGGEFFVDDHLDRALVRIDTYGADEADALDLAGTVRALVWLLPDVPLPGGAVVSDVAESRGPSWLRDPALATANRYTTRYLVPVRVRSRAG